MTFVPCLERSVEDGELRAITLGHPLLDDYLEFVGARGATNTWLATAYDLKVFFEVVGKDPADVTAEFALTRLFRSLPLRSAVATYAELERTCPSTEITSKHPANRKLAATLCILQFQHHTIVDSRNLFHSHIRIEHQTKTVVVSRGSGQRNRHCPRSQIGWRLEARH